MQTVDLACCRARESEGVRIDISNVMIAMTTSNSSSVKAHLAEIEPGRRARRLSTGDCMRLVNVLLLQVASARRPRPGPDALLYAQRQNVRPAQTRPLPPQIAGRIRSPTRNRQ